MIANGGPAGGRCRPGLGLADDRIRVLVAPGARLCAKRPGVLA
jgi:hypothetical protein